MQIGNIISYTELSTTTGQGFTSLKKYLNLLEKTYIAALIKPFFINRRTELVKNPKGYFYDTGLRNAVIGDFKRLDTRQDKGILYENFIFTKLIKENFTLKYWRTKSKAEVDFVINDKTPVEVKSNISRARGGKSLLSFIEKYRPENAFVFNRDILGKIEVSKTDIFFLYHFLPIMDVELTVS